MSSLARITQSINCRSRPQTPEVCLQSNALTPRLHCLTHHRGTKGETKAQRRSQEVPRGAVQGRTLSRPLSSSPQGCGDHCASFPQARPAPVDFAVLINAPHIHPSITEEPTFRKPTVYEPEIRHSPNGCGAIHLGSPSPPTWTPRGASYLGSHLPLRHFLHVVTRVLPLPTSPIHSSEPSHGSQSPPNPSPRHRDPS